MPYDNLKRVLIETRTNIDGILSTRPNVITPIQYNEQNINPSDVNRLNNEDAYTTNAIQAMWNIIELIYLIANSDSWFENSKIALRIISLNKNLNYLETSTWVPQILNEDLYSAGKFFYDFLDANSSEQSEGRQLLNNNAAGTLNNFIFHSVKNSLATRLENYRSTHPLTAAPVTAPTITNTQPINLIEADKGRARILYGYLKLLSENNEPPFIPTIDQEAIPLNILIRSLQCNEPITTEIRTIYANQNSGPIRGWVNLAQQINFFQPIVAGANNLATSQDTHPTFNHVTRNDMRRLCLLIAAELREIDQSLETRKLAQLRDEMARYEQAALNINNEAQRIIDEATTQINANTTLFHAQNYNFNTHLVRMSISIVIIILASTLSATILPVALIIPAIIIAIASLILVLYSIYNLYNLSKQRVLEINPVFQAQIDEARTTRDHNLALATDQHNASNRAIMENTKLFYPDANPLHSTTDQQPTIQHNDGDISPNYMLGFAM